MIKTDFGRLQVSSRNKKQKNKKQKNKKQKNKKQKNNDIIIFSFFQKDENILHFFFMYTFAFSLFFSSF